MFLSLITLFLLPVTVTSFSLEELFVNAPEMQKLVRIAEEPGVIEVLFQSANSKKVFFLFKAVMIVIVVFFLSRATPLNFMKYDILNTA